jgi:hypothetical protein
MGRKKKRKKIEKKKSTGLLTSPLTTRPNAY